MNARRSSGSGSAGYRIEPPLPGHPLELARPAVFEAEAGAGDEILDGPRDEDLAGRRRRGDSRADVHGDTGDLLARDFAFARVEPGADDETQSGYRIADRLGAADRARRTVKGGEEAVPRRVDLPPAEAADLVADAILKALEKIPPAAVAELLGPLGRADNVGE